jgi:acyl carrier protein
MLNEKKLLNIIQAVLKSKKVDISTSMQNNSKWDSLNHLNILEKLDKATKGKAGNIADLATATSIKKLIIILKKNKLFKA